MFTTAIDLVAPPFWQIQQNNWYFILRCEASNEADDLPAVDDSLGFHSSKNRKAAKVTLLVQYAPSVSVQPIRPGMVQEGDEVL